MAAKSSWSIIEGGISNTFPLSLNRTSYWTALRKGECFYHDMISRDQRGILAYAKAPEASQQCFTKPLSETDVIKHNKRAFNVRGFYVGGVPLNEDSEDPILLVCSSPSGDRGTLFAIKSTCGYTITNFGESNQVVSAPNYSVGTDLTSPHQTNAVYSGAILLAKNGRSFLWDGSPQPIELSEDVRELSKSEKAQTGSVNWDENLLIFGRIQYDYREKKIFYYSGAGTASLITRPYYAPNYAPLTLYRMAFICDGREGSFDATIEYGQAYDRLAKTKTFTVRISQNSRNRFRHVWILDMPVLCRVWRLSITKLTGVGISQIEVDSSVSDSPDAADGTE